MAVKPEYPRLEGWCTVADAASRLGLSRQRVHRMMQTGVFTTVHQMGDRPLYVIQTAEVEQMASRRSEEREEQK